MRRITLILLCVLAAAAQAQDAVRFASVDIYLDSAAPIAAWQFELQDHARAMRVVGVENGDSPAFERAPYYDRDAVSRGAADRIVVADYSLADADRLPVGRTRIATIHFTYPADREPDFDLALITAAGYDGTVIDAAISLASSTGSEQ